MNEIIINALLLISGATGQYIVSAFLIPKKEKKEAEAGFIDTLLERVSFLEGKIDVMSLQLNEIMRENERLKIQLEYKSK